MELGKHWFCNKVLQMSPELCHTVTTALHFCLRKVRMTRSSHIIDCDHEFVSKLLYLSIKSGKGGMVISI